MFKIRILDVLNIYHKISELYAITFFVLCKSFFIFITKLTDSDFFLLKN